MRAAHDVDPTILISRFEDALELASMRALDEAGRKIINPITIPRDHERRQPIIPNETPRIVRRHSVPEEWFEPKFMRRKAPDSGLVQPDDSMRCLQIGKRMQALAHEKLPAWRPTE